jgi:pSer/pThr/pTyr-binding forkhead associated (FHA) protein
MFEVTICSADGKTLRRFDLSRLHDDGARVVVGRAEDCEIRIKSPSISRHHCAIEIDDHDWIIRDLGSTHGTMVDGVQISEAAVVPGLKVVIGPAVLLFQSSTSRIAAEIGKELEGKG